MENMSRQELLEFIKSKEKKLDELKAANINGENVDIGQIDHLEKEIENANNQLKQIAELEDEYDSRSNFAGAKQLYEEEEKKKNNTMKNISKVQNLMKNKIKMNLL